MSGREALPGPFRPPGDGGPGARGAPPTPASLRPPPAGAAFVRRPDPAPRAGPDAFGAAPGGRRREPRPEPFAPRAPAGGGDGKPAPEDPREGFEAGGRPAAGAAGRGGARSWSRTRRRRRLRPAHAAPALGIALLLGLVWAAYHYRDLLVATFIRAPAGVALRPVLARPEAPAPQPGAAGLVAPGGPEARSPAGQGGAASVAAAPPGSGGEAGQAPPPGGSPAPPAAETRLPGEGRGAAPRAMQALASGGTAPPGLPGGWREPGFVAPPAGGSRLPGGVGGAGGSGGWPESGAGAPAGPGSRRAPAAWGDESGAGPGREAGSDRARVVIRRRPVREQVDAGLREAYLALQAGDLPAARRAYEERLREGSGQRDARLGLAAVALREGRIEDATRHYLRVLRLDPRDGAALAALVSLDEDADPAQSRSLLRGLLRESPEAAHLSFGLGSVFVRERRWAEARQAFLDAHRKERGNPDYAYNLAVSLDRLARREGALAYYRLALELAERRPASFDAGVVRGRIRAIGQDPGS